VGPWGYLREPRRCTSEPRRDAESGTVVAAADSEDNTTRAYEQIGGGGSEKDVRFGYWAGLGASIFSDGRPIAVQIINRPFSDYNWLISKNKQ
jgi:hypothetical protein